MTARTYEKKYFSVCLYITGTGNQMAVSTVSAASNNSKCILKLLASLSW